MEAKKKEEQKSPEMIAIEQENKLLKEQLNKLSSAQESLTLEKEAEKIAKETAALEAEADLRKTLGEEFSTVKAGLREGEELSADQLVAIMADAVGVSSDAQAKLILKKVEAMMGKSDAEIKRTQKLLIELAAGISMNEVRSKNTDFDDYKTEIAGIMSVTRGLSPEDAYLLAKAKRSKGQPEQQQVESERPSTPPNASSSRDAYTHQHQSEDDEVKRSPRAVFKAAADAAIEKLLANRQR